tara:strand:- start:9730 stop:11313 length:1584 start_codon:yes stop_codon:yes gene_type:complete
VATRKISDLTELVAGQVSSSDTLLLLDNSDPTDQNKRSAVGSIFRALPGGSYTTPGLGFEGRTSTGLFSETQGQVSLAMGNARLNLQKVGSTLKLDAKDSADANLDLTITAQGTGKIRLGSILALTDEVFLVPNSVDETKVAKFNTASIPTGVTHTYILPSNGSENAADTLVTLGASQTLTNKTIADGVFTGTLSVADVSASGNVTLGSDAADTVTMNGVTSFSAGATFNNSVVMNQGLTSSSSVTAPRVILNDDSGSGSVIEASQNDQSNFLFKYFNETYASASSVGFGGWIGDDGTAYFRHNGNSEYKSIIFDQGDGPGPDPQRVLLELGAGGDVILKYQGSTKLSTTTTGISIGGTIDTVTDITSTGNIVTTGTAHSIGASSAAKLGVGRTATTYNLEVEGSIFATGSSLILGDTGSSKAIIQKRAVGLGLHFADESGVDQAVLDGNGNFGIGKNPSYRLDVSGNSWVDGDITINTTNPVAKTGGKVTAREILLIDPQTGASTTLDATSAGGVSRAKVYFHSFN